MSVAAAHVPPRSSVARLVTERSVALASIGLVGLHVADDNFLQPEPGMSPVDHLPGGLALLALVAAGAWAYTRVRAGARASIALLAGFLGVLAATEAVYYTAADAPSGDDFTGFLSLLAGFVLLGVGITTLWRARRGGDSRRRRYTRRSLATLGAVGLMALLLFPLAISYVVTHTARAVVPTPHLGAAHEEVSFTTRDGLRLEGWFIPSRNGATVIAFPGRSGPQAQTRMLVRHGYGVLLFDRRGEGASEGDPNIFGWAGDRDLDAAVDYLRGRPDVDPERIGGIGLSVGGEMLIHAAAHNTALKAIVSEGASGQSMRDGIANAGLVEGFLTDAGGTLGDGALLEHAAAAEPEERGGEDRAARRLPRLWRERPERNREAAEPGLLRRRGRAEAALGGPERPAHRRDHDRTGRVRAPRDRLLRPRTPMSLAAGGRRTYDALHAGVDAYGPSGGG